MWGVRSRYVVYGIVLVCLWSVLGGCSSDSIGGDSASPVYLVAQAASNWGTVIDVYDSTVAGGVTDEYFNITIRSIYKNQTETPTTTFADVILQEYRITYYRVDGNPDVPEPVTFHLSALVPAGGTYAMQLHLLRREAKLESPLKELAFGGGEGTIELNAYVQFYGEDLMGNAVSTDMVVDITATDL